jgi:hypothetical protein
MIEEALQWQAEIKNEEKTSVASDITERISS